jgi:Leucine-rich repeat (LRR) protein
LNEQIESDVWEDYSEAILSTIRYYFRNQKSIENADTKYLETAKGILPSLVNLNPHIESMLLTSSTEVIYKTELWESTKEIQDLIESWEKAIPRRGPSWLRDREKLGSLKSFKGQEFEFQNELYNIRDISVKHLIGVKKSQGSSFLLGLKKKLTETDVYILAIAKEIEENSLILAMNTLKRAAMGFLPPSGENLLDKSLKTSKDMASSELDTILQRRKEKIEKSQAISSTSYKWKSSREKELAKNYDWWEKEKEKTFKVKTYPVLMRLATQVNVPLDLEEKKVLGAVEKQIGKRIQRISADIEQELTRNDLMSIKDGKVVQRKSLDKLPWMHADESFPARKFPFHYISLNGKIILLTLFNMSLSEIPSEISNLRNLTYLNLNSNSLTDLPKKLSKLKSLVNLFLDNNQFTKVPLSLIEFSSLQNLYMRNNKISKIPLALTDAWQARIEDPAYRGSIYIPCNLIFSGNPIDHNSLSKDQLELLTSKSSRKYSEKIFLML